MWKGTVIKSMHDHYIAWRKSFLVYGIEIKKKDYYPLEGLKLREIAKIISKKYCILNPDIEKIVQKKELLYNFKAKINFYSGVKKFINILINKRIKIGIVTAGQKERLYNSLPFVFLDKFDVIVTSNDYKKGKPSPDPYLLSCKLLNIKKTNCIVIENSPLGIKSAKAAGLFCIGISSTVKKDLLKEADILVDNFKDLFKLDLLNNTI